MSSPTDLQNGRPLVRRCQSTERLFLADLTSGAPRTAGGRLAAWLQPESRVAPERCDVRLPGAPRVGTPLLVCAAPRDQYGDFVRSPALKVEMVVQLAEAGRRAPADAGMFGGRAPPPRDVPYQPVARDNVLFHSITVMKPYMNYSFEELRAAAGGGGGEGACVPPERLSVRPLVDGTYSAAWMARAPGLYAVECTLDGISVGQALFVEVKEPISAGLPSTSARQSMQVKEAPLPTRPMKMRKFCAPETAGLRVRMHPSLQSEEIGVIPPDANISFTDEVGNEDGTWLRLSTEAVNAFLHGGTSAPAAAAIAADPPDAWCLQYHRQLDRILLEPLDAKIPTAKTEEWEACPKHTNQNVSPLNSQSEHDSDNDNEDNEDSILVSSLRLRKGFNFRGNNDSDSDSDGGANPFVFGPKVDGEDFKAMKILGAKEKGPLQFLRRVMCQSKNGNGCSDWDDVPSPEEDEAPPDPVSNENNASDERLSQAGTQTSPDNRSDGGAACGGPDTGGSSSKTENTSPLKTFADKTSRFGKRTAAPSVAPPPQHPSSPPKYAMSPSQAQCYRAIFAALLWHEGIVHDAMACAAFLKFHPQLPKQGFRVVTRTTSASGGEMTSAARALKHQRHSVEVSSAGQYLHIQPSTLESLTRSANNANANRSRGKRHDAASAAAAAAAAPSISEEEVPGNSPETLSVPAPTVVNVLPPALRALVALWDKLAGARELRVTPDKFMNEEELEKMMCGVDRKSFLNKSLNNVKVECTAASTSESSYAVNCELCSGRPVAPPLASHMGLAHPGCKEPCSRGYDRLGCYVDAGPTATPCGQLAQGYYVWYMYCERCRDMSIKATSTCMQGSARSFSPQAADAAVSVAPVAAVNHYQVLENALFLLELAPVTNSDSGGVMPRSPPTPAGSPWVPAPPFQSLNSLGVSPYVEEELDQEVLIRQWEENGIGGVYQELIQGYSIEQLGQIPGLLHPMHAMRFHRSISMGQAGGSRDLASEGRALFMRHHELYSGDAPGGSASLLATPSSALQKLVSSGGAQPGRDAGAACSISALATPALDLSCLLGRPVLTFVRGARDLQALRQTMDAAVRISTVRQYALEALNWLLRTVTQPTSLHDVMWWFCSALEQFAKCDNTNNDFMRNQSAPEGGWVVAESWAVAGGAGGGGRAALHSLLQSVAELMPHLPPTCPALLQAVRCWALQYSSADHILLHKSQVFSVISNILSHTEEDLYEESIVGLLPEEHGDDSTSKESFTWRCRDVTDACVVSVSSRPAAAAALTDGTTETFWESGDEERAEPRWIQVTMPSGEFDEKPHLICLHIDNTRDTVNKVLMITFLYSGNSTELFQMQEVEVDLKSATWIKYTLPRNATPPLRIRCELRGPDPSVRVRQLKVLAVPSAEQPAASTSHYRAVLERVQPAALILHHTVEQETLRVFRLITSQVFGKLLEWEPGGGGDGGAAGPSAAGYSRAESPSGGADPAESDLRERLVGILFSGSKMTNLQKQVMAHVVTAIGAEAQKAREDWESALAAGVAEEPPASPGEAPDLLSQDNYCYEMLSLLLALSGSQVGLQHLARRLELLPDLMSLLHTGSNRAQRQVISLLQRLIGEISPPKMLSALNPVNDGSISRVSLIDHLATYVCKAISLQVKVKGASGVSGAGGSKEGAAATPRALCAGAGGAGACVAPPPPGFWFLRGHTPKNLAQLVIRLLKDMAEETMSVAWGAETRAALARYTVRLAGVPDGERRAERCLAGAAVWHALAALCVIEESYAELIASGLRTETGEASARLALDARENRPFCTNHDDGETLAVVDCRSCGPLCHECDRCLHLNRAARTHHRQICKEEESTIRVDIHEGCGRAKLFWLLLLVDRRTLKALAEFRGASAGSAAAEDEPRRPPPGPPGMAGVCRFCGTRGNAGLLAIGNVCADQDCQEHNRWVCPRVLPCGHLCGGARGERTCLPCLHGCAAPPTLRQDADDMCMICFTEPLAAAPALQLKCGHVFHLHCCKKVLNNKWNGPRITFSYSQCPICKEDMQHEVLEDELAPLRRLQEEVQRKALMRLDYEGVNATPAGSRQRRDLAAYAMERYAYYACFKCGKAYFGGLARCDAEASAQFDPSELVCGACSDIRGARTCAKHGADFLEYKCRYCCSVAVFFCFGTSHFCNMCHDDFQRVTNIDSVELPHCPAGPKATQLDGTSDDCPLHMSHPATGEEFALGCGVCRNSHTF